MLKLGRSLLVPAGLVVAAVWSTPVHAHIDMVGALLSRGGDQKSSPCDGARGDGPVYTFQPGATITLELDEGIPHPSYFRIAFDNDGDDGFVEPASIKPIEASRACPYNADDQCGESDFCNVMSTTGEATVLWDNLNPHTAADAKSMKWNVTLPDVECENCTIQVIQVMEDTLGHGAYCPQGSCENSAGSLEDIYHRCIDVTLKRDATNSPGATTDPVANMGMECAASVVGAAGSGAEGAAGSAAAGTGASAAAGAGAAAGVGAAGAAAAAGSGAAGAPAAAGAAAPSAAAGAASAAGSVAVPVAASGAAGSPAGGAAGRASVASPTTAAGAAAPEAPASAPESDSCSVSQVGGSSSSLPGLACLAFGTLFAVNQRRRRRR